MTTIPLLATKAVDCNSPVEGLYKSLALLVLSVAAVPVVALENRGKRLLAVEVSLTKAAPPTEANAVPL